MKQFLLPCSSSQLSLHGEGRTAIFTPLQALAEGFLVVMRVPLLFRSCVCCPSWGSQGRARAHKVTEGESSAPGYLIVILDFSD